MHTYASMQNRLYEQVYQFLNDEQSLHVFYVNSNMSEESKQQNSELSEQVKQSTEENGVLRLELDELRKRLEIAGLMLQQVQ